MKLNGKNSLFQEIGKERKRLLMETMLRSLHQFFRCQNWQTITFCEGAVVNNHSLYVILNTVKPWSNPFFSPRIEINIICCSVVPGLIIVFGCKHVSQAFIAKCITEFSVSLIKIKDHAAVIGTTERHVSAIEDGTIFQVNHVDGQITLDQKSRLIISQKFDIPDLLRFYRQGNFSCLFSGLNSMASPPITSACVSLFIKSFDFNSFSSL